MVSDTHSHLLFHHVIVLITALVVEGKEIVSKGYLGQSVVGDSAIRRIRYFLNDTYLYSHG